MNDFFKFTTAAASKPSITVSHENHSSTDKAVMSQTTCAYLIQLFKLHNFCCTVVQQKLPLSLGDYEQNMKKHNCSDHDLQHIQDFI